MVLNRKLVCPLLQSQDIEAYKKISDNISESSSALSRVSPPPVFQSPSEIDSSAFSSYCGSFRYYLHWTERNYDLIRYDNNYFCGWIFRPANDVRKPIVYCSIHISGANHCKELTYRDCKGKPFRDGPHLGGYGIWTAGEEAKAISLGRYNANTNKAQTAYNELVRNTPFGSCLTVFRNWCQANGILN